MYNIEGDFYINLYIQKELHNLILYDLCLHFHLTRPCFTLLREKSLTFDFDRIAFGSIGVYGLLVFDDDLCGILVEAEQDEGLLFAQFEHVVRFNTFRVYFDA